MSIRKARNQSLRNLSIKKKSEFYQRYIGTTRPVLIEAGDDRKKGYGFTDNYIKVELDHPSAHLANEIKNVRLDFLQSDLTIRGTVESPEKILI